MRLWLAGPSNRQEGGLDAVAGPSNRRNGATVVAGPSNRQEGGLDAVAGPSNRREGNKDAVKKLLCSVDI